MILKRIFTLLPLVFLLSFAPELEAQIDTDSLDGRINTINTAVPFLRIAPDARSGAMGDAGLAVSPDANAIFWNPSKLAFVENKMGFSLTYTPWLRELVQDIYLADLTGFVRVDDLQTIGGSIRFFSLGSIQFRDISGNDNGNYKPSEFAIDIAYARKLSENFSASLAAKYVFSDLATGQEVNGEDIVPGKAIAADISAFYTNPDLSLGEMDANLGIGANISNLGTKVSYTNNALNKDFIPTNLGIGAAFGMDIDEYNSITFALDFNKLLVPTPDTLDEDGNDVLDYKEQSSISGIFSSFGDAPGGGAEEFREFMTSFGVEYWYSNQFAVRGGYFHEHATKGNRKFVTLGLGVKYNVFGLNFSYLIPTSGQRNPLNNTLRFSLLFDFENLKAKGEDVEEEG